MSTDGRLDLDDLGRVIDDAAHLDATGEHEVIADGHGDTWTERLDRVGLTPWLRRHRGVVLAATTALVVIAVGAAAWTHAQPPPLDPQLHVTAADITPSPVVDGLDGTPTYDSPGLYEIGTAVRGAYGLLPDDRSDPASYTLTALLGPGVRASSVHRHEAESTDQPFAFDVDVVLDCFDPTALVPPPSSYWLEVTRTDAYGRTVSGRVPAPESVVHWGQYTSARCTQAQAQEALSTTSLTTSVDAVRHTVALRVGVTSSMPLDGELTAMPAYGTPAVETALPPTPLPAASRTTLGVSLVVHDCTDPTPAPLEVEAGRSGPNIITEQVAGVSLEWTRDRSDDYAARGFAVLRWSPGQARLIQAALQASCAGAPRTSVAVASVGAGVPATTPQPDGRGSLTRFPLRVAVTSDGTTVRVASPPALSDEYVPWDILPTSASLAAGHGVVDTTWRVDCASGYVPPPVVRLSVTTSKGTFPFQRTLTQSALADAAAAACTTVTLDQLWSSGFDRPVVHSTSAVSS